MTNKTKNVCSNQGVTPEILPAHASTELFSLLDVYRVPLAAARAKPLHAQKHFQKISVVRSLFVQRLYRCADK